MSEPIEAVATYLNCGAIVTDDISTWGGVHECLLIDALLEATMIEFLSDPTAFIQKHPSSMIHELGHRFVQMGMGIAIQEELR